MKYLFSLLTCLVLAHALPSPLPAQDTTDADQMPDPVSARDRVTVHQGEMQDKKIDKKDIDKLKKDAEEDPNTLRVSGASIEVNGELRPLYLHADVVKKKTSWWKSGFYGLGVVALVYNGLVEATKIRENSGKIVKLALETKNVTLAAVNHAASAVSRKTTKTANKVYHKLDDHRPVLLVSETFNPSEQRDRICMYQSSILYHIE